MTAMLKPNQVVRIQSAGMSCQVGQLLGSGGQGEVYQARLGDQQVALKWYAPASATPPQRAALETLIKQGPPTTRFLWPMDLATAEGVDGFGYIMPLREPRYKGIDDWIARRVSPSFRTLATAGLQLAESYYQLHIQGLCYRDISFGNAFFDPATGDIVICDNDNVTVNGEPVSGVLGTLRFMAPEIVRGEALPSTNTDLFSLAVLLFYLFIVNHPLEGRREAEIEILDPAAQVKLYGTDPLFIFDPQDASNRPVPGYQDNALIFWPIYPQFLREHFTKSFTIGLRDPMNGRVAETIWRGAMSRLRDSIFPCSSCSAENFYDSDALQAAGGQISLCWSCKRPLQLPPRLRLAEDRIVMLTQGAQLFAHHLDSHKPGDFSQPLAIVVEHPTIAGLWGLKNLSSERWTVTKEDGTIMEVEPGRSASLAKGIKIHFGAVEGAVRV